MGRRKTLPDEEVLKAARAAFLRHGHAASTREIAEDVGLSQATLFQRYGDKTDLFTAAMLPEPIDIAFILEGPGDGSKAGSKEVLLGVAIRLHQVLTATLPLIRTLAGHPDLDPRILEQAHRQLGVPDLIASLERCFSDWRDDGQLPVHLDPSALTEALLLATHGLAMMAMAGSAHADVKDQLRRFADLLWR
jgi:AcrR family transcriptional regulator